MKNRVTKLLAVLLVFALSLSVCACSSKTADNTGAADNTGTAAPAVSAEATETAGDEVVEIYFEGFMPWIGSAGKVQSSAEAMAKVQQYVIDQIGVKPVVVQLPSGSEQEKLNLMIADPNEQLDIIMMNPTWESWNKLAENGQILPLNDLLDAHGSDIQNAFSGDLASLMDAMTDKDGNIYALPRALENTSFPVYIRTDWLNALGLEMPTTIEELEAVIQAFAENDPAGNGETVPVLIANEAEGLDLGMSAGFTEYGYGYWLDPSDNLIKPSELQPGFKDLLSTVNKWYSNGWLHQDTFTLAWGDYEDLFMAGRLGVIIGSYGITANNMANLKAINPDANYEYADGIQGPAGFLETRSKASNSGMMITSKCEHPEAAMKLLNWVISDNANFLTMMYGLEGEGWEWVDESKGYYKLLDTSSYGGELYIWPNNYSLRQIGQVNDAGELDLASQFMMVDQYRYSTTKSAFDTSIFWDSATIEESFPNTGDVDKMISENVIKFATGQRSLDEWDTFVSKDLPAAGLAKYEQAYTDFYNANK